MNLHQINERFNKILEPFQNTQKYSADFALKNILLTVDIDSDFDNLEQFHKYFRQTNATENYNIDLCIWHLIYETKMFRLVFDNEYFKTWVL